MLLSLLSILFAIVGFICFFLSILFVSKQLIFVILGFIFIIISLLIVIIKIIDYFSYKSNAYSDRLKDWNRVSYFISDVGDVLFNKLPIGILIYDDDNKIIWINSFLETLFKSNLKNLNIENISIDLFNFLNSKKDKDIITINNRIFEILHNDQTKSIYFFDETSRQKEINLLREEKASIGFISIDNFEESLKRFDLQGKAQLKSDLIGLISYYLTQNNCYMSLLEGNVIVFFTSRINLLKMMDDKFIIISQIRDKFNDFHLKITISIGASCIINENFLQIGQIALNCLEMAKKRGGDQAVCNIDNKTSYIGGLLNALEKNTYIDSRVHANDLKELVTKSQDVFIMTHHLADCDAFGSVICAYKLLVKDKPDIKIVLDYDLLDETSKKFYNFLEEKYPDFLNYFISIDDCLLKFNDNSLLLICDTQSEDLVMFPSLLEKSKNVCVIDHHRPGDKVFKNVILQYVETYSSSTIELICEMFMFYDTKTDPNSYEATLMMAGLMIDTNNFTLRTGARTFEVASMLKEWGADILLLKKLLRDNLDDEKIIANSIINFEHYKNMFAIYSTEDENLSDKTIFSKISDRLLTINMVDASFCIGKIKDSVFISARSIDKVNVQLIMEELGGGGHLQSAACQLKCSIEEAKQKLYDILDRFCLGGEKLMKVILLSDVKGRGKKNDIIEVPNAYGNFLCKKKLAVFASDEKKEAIEAQIRQEEILRIQKNTTNLKLKEEIESKSVTVFIKVGPEGISFGHITPKQICEEFEKQNGIRLDKRKVEIPQSIDQVGIFEGSVILDSNIIAKFKINVIEK